MRKRRTRSDKGKKRRPSFRPKKPNLRKVKVAARKRKADSDYINQMKSGIELGLVGGMGSSLAAGIIHKQSLKGVAKDFVRGSIGGTAAGLAIGGYQVSKNRRKNNKIDRARTQLKRGNFA